VYRRADLSRITVLVAALLLTAISTGAFACGFAAGDPRNILTTPVTHGPALTAGHDHATGVFHCRRFRAEMEPGPGQAGRGRIGTAPIVGSLCEVKQT
jgi:hypothetical protein